MIAKQIKWLLKCGSDLKHLYKNRYAVMYGI